jgi:acyl-CoA synthetase (AMP-forming)/AMP-acid ligase II
LNDSGAKAIFTQKALLDNAVKAAAEAGIPRERIVLIGDEHDTGFLHFSKILGGVLGVREKLDPDRDLAFLVYSSGTTGLPKGVMLSHLNVFSNLLMFHSREGSSFEWKNDKVLSVLPYYHIYGMFNPSIQPIKANIEC